MDSTRIPLHFKVEDMTLPLGHEGSPIQLPELSEWTLVICGHSGLRVTPLKGEEPGPIRRWLCKLLLGFEWRKNW